MIRTFHVMNCPLWAEIAKPCSISYLMERLLDTDIKDVDVQIWHGGRAYITLKNHDGSASFIYMRQDLWRMVEHMINQDPMQCHHCWMCDWRRSRSRYNKSSQYAHLYIK